jgi:integrase
MLRPEFHSVFAKELNAYFDYRTAACKGERFLYFHMRQFDKFCVEQMINIPVFTIDNANKWKIKKESEASTTYYARINQTKNFLTFLSIKGYDVVVIRDVKFKETSFIPYIYNDDEIKRYFIAVDSFSSVKNKKASIQYPVLFRILYCCGTRIGETLGIRKVDVDLEDGIIKLNETKNNHERYIVLSDDMKYLMEQFADKCFYLINDDDFIFSTYNRNRLSGGDIYKLHRNILQQAGIPYRGEGHGPRIHDWRHTMAVKSFKQMIDSGMDMYVALPILSTYLGHKTIHATERYVKLVMNIYPHIEKLFGKKIQKIFKKVTCFEDD